MSEGNTNQEYIDGNAAPSDSGLVIPEEVLPMHMHVIPVFNRPFFPAQIQPIVLDEAPWLETLEDVFNTSHQCAALCYSEETNIDHLTPDKFATMGCVAKIHNILRDEGKIQFIAQGLTRLRIVRWLRPETPFFAEISYPKPPTENQEEVKAYAMALINLIKQLVATNPLYTEELRNYLTRFGPNDPSPLSDFGAAMTTGTASELQQVLNTVPLLKRMEKVLLLLRKELEVAKLQTKITEQVNEKISENQRRFFLREQLKVIQKELGVAKDDKQTDIEEFKSRVSNLTLPEQASTRFDNELHKLSILETGSPEYGVTRNYLDWITSVPWGVYSKDNLDLKTARKVLEEHHDGLGDVKDHIIEFLAAGAFKGEVIGSILLLVGPPGVGKTSIGRSIADALGRKFYRFSLGGMRDEAEIKGHRRTYIGAMPGKFIQSLKEVGVANPMIMLDEIDKVGASFRGDPASALLEALDPEQNSEFLDHYLDLRVDLSRVLFVCTANQLDTIPPPLLDRMDVIRLSGYITEEKISIARHHLWPRLLIRAGIKPGHLKISNGAIKQVIEGYAREAGVRNLEKTLNKIVRKTVVKMLETNTKKFNVNIKDLESYLGQPIFRPEKKIQGIGVVTGLAWTAMGGATLPVEATLVHTRNPGLKLTGQLGDVMKESAEIAYSYVSSHNDALGGKKDFFEKSTIHLHVPEGATPKDGPSAGITMATALLSLSKGKKLPRVMAMTGELTLTGQVLAVGGIREKIIAAKRQKISEIIMPEANRRDHNELPDYILKGMKVSFASHYDDVVNLIYGKS